MIFNNSSNNPLGIKIKKLKILTLQKNISTPFLPKNFFNKNKTPTLNQIPFLLKYTTNSSTNMTTIPFKKKLLSLLKGNKSKKNFANVSRYLFDEPSDSDFKNDKNLKSNIEMKDKFYIRQREGLKRESKPELVLNIDNDTPSYKLYLNLKNKPLLINGEYYENDSLNDNRNFVKKKYFRNRSESIFMTNKNKTTNQINIKDILNESKDPKEKQYSSFIMPKLNTFFSKNINHKQKRINEINYLCKENEKKSKLFIKYRKSKPNNKNIADENYEIFKKIFKNRARKNAKMFSKSLIDIQDDNEGYESIYEKESENNIKNKIYFNKNNLERLIKVDKTNKKGYNEDDIINNVYKLKKFNDNTEFILKKLRHTRVPKAVKINNFSHSTLVKYNNLHRSNFGLPS